MTIFHPSKGASRLIILAILLLTLITFSYGSLAFSYQKISLSPHTVQIRTNLGQPLVDIELLENTDQCLVVCHATLRITPHQPFTLPPQATDSDNLQFFKADPTHKGLQSSSFELLLDTQETVTIPTYQTIEESCFQKNTSTYEPCPRTVESGSATQTITKHNWIPFNPWGYTFLPEKSYIIRITGQKIPSLGPNNIDWLLTVRGVQLTEWAWWNSTWQFRRQITVQNNNQSASLLAGYTMTFTLNTTGDSFLDSGDDVRIVFNDSLELDRAAYIPFNANDTSISFRTQQFVGPGASDARYYVYYGNPIAGTPPRNVSNIFNYSDTFADYPDGMLNGRGEWKADPNVTVNGTVYPDPNGQWDGNKKLEILKSEQLGLHNITARKQATFSVLMLRCFNSTLCTKSAPNGFGNSDTAWFRVWENNTIITGVAFQPTDSNIIASTATSDLVIGHWGFNEWREIQLAVLPNNTFDILLYNATKNPDGSLNSTFINRSAGLVTKNPMVGGINKIDVFLQNTGGTEDTGAFDWLRIKNLFLPEPTVSVGLQENGNATLLVMDMIPIQVVRNVDLIKGKPALVRVSMRYLPAGNNSNHTATLAELLLGGIQQNFTNYSLNPLPLTPEKDSHLDVFFTPNTDGTHLNLTARLLTTIPGLPSLNTTTAVNVTRTRHLNISFVSVNVNFGMVFRNGIPVGPFAGGPSDYIDTSLAAQEFLSKTYPLSADGVSSNVPTVPVGLLASRPLFFYSDHGANDLDWLRDLVYQAGQLPGTFPELVVGVVNNDFLHSVTGHYSTGLSKFFDHSVFVSDGTRSSAAHETGHYYGLCDEYNDTMWSTENTTLSQAGFPGCPNGDSELPGGLDYGCLNGPFDQVRGCQTYTLEPLSSVSDDTVLYNLMSSYDAAFDLGFYWITNETFAHLVSQLRHFSPVLAANRIMITGHFNRSGSTAGLGAFYTLGEGLAENVSADTGTGDLQVRLVAQNGSYVQNLSFSLSFIVLLGNSTAVNITDSSFSIVVPFPDNITRIDLLENAIVKAQRNVSPSTPVITVLSPNGGEAFTNEPINITWSASDGDGDSLTYSILMSLDNGTTFSTVALGINVTFLVLNSSDLADCDKCLVRVLATDGVNAARDTSDATFSVDNDLNISQFVSVLTNGTGRVLYIIVNNTFKEGAIHNVTWSVNTSDGSFQSSAFGFLLNASESIQLLLYHNFSFSGNHGVDLLFRSDDMIERGHLGVLI